MKIAIFTDIFLDTTGGIRSSIMSQKTDLEKRGHIVYVFCPGLKPNKDPTIRIVPTMKFLKINGTALAKSPKKVIAHARKELARLDVDIVHVHHEMFASIAGMKLAREMEIPLVQTMHGREDVAIEKNLPPGVNFIASWIINKAHARIIPHTTKIKRDNYLAHSKTARNMWEMMINHANYADYVVTPTEHFLAKLRHYGLKKPATNISNGMDDALVAKTSKAKVREMKPGDNLKMIWFSRMSNEKRPMEFLKAVQMSGIAAELEMYGDGNAVEKAKRYAKKHNMRNIKVLGRKSRETIMPRLAWAHINVVNSYGFDTQGMTLLEGIATGLPAIFVDPDMEETMPKNSYVLVKSKSIKDMAAALKNLTKHPEKIKKMSQAALKEKDSILQSHQTTKLLKVYERVKGVPTRTKPEWGRGGNGP